MSRLEVHHQELRRLMLFVGGFGLVAALSYLVPGTELVRPWIAGEPVPFVHLFMGERRVVEGEDGLLVARTGTTSLDEIMDSDTGLDESISGPLPMPEDALALEAEPPAATGAQENPKPKTLVATAASPPEAQGDGLAMVTGDTPPPEGTLRLAEAPSPAPVAPLPADGLRDRTPARGTPIEMGPGAMDTYFKALARVEAGEPGFIARTLHFGDSTIAADGITRTVRKRFQDRFGDGGPGFLAVHVDSRWATRPGILRKPQGSWKTRNITFGGAENSYYGLAGTVSTAYSKSSSTLGGLKVGESLQPLHRFDIFYQRRPGGGSFYAKPAGVEGAGIGTGSEHTGDGFHDLRVPEGTSSLHISTSGDGPVTIYGVALETAGPGITWETLGVAGAGTGSLLRQGPNHLARQIERREPHLIVYQIGGNEVGLPSLKSSTATVYRERYRKAVTRLRAGAPGASCLLITPLDQGERYRNAIRSKPNLNNLIKVQRELAGELGCAFWDARAAMGGPDSFARWLERKLAWSDLHHLTGKGLALIGHTLADAIEGAYAQWRKGRRGAAISQAASGSHGG